MVTLSSQIESYIKELLESSEGAVELRRSDLADTFMCVPSQINYVLETRFNTSQGYYVESRRGGGGYLKIIRLDIHPQEDLLAVVNSMTGKRFSQSSGESLLNRLIEENFLTKREGILLKSVIDGNILKNILEDSDYLRGRLLQTVLINILREDFEKEE
ncbi:MAG: CtsR family transcriptional regulator [Clostridiales bacterium]